MAAPAPSSMPADAQSCSLCMDPFATEAAGPSISDDRRPRVLGCGHSFCGACLHEDMQRRRCCALCQAPIAQPNAAAVPVNFDLIGAMKTAEGAAAQIMALRLQVEAAHAAHRQTAVPCAECDQTATLFCEPCDGDFCADHSRQVHALKTFQSHNVMRVEEKAAFLAGKLRRDAEGEAQSSAKKCALHPDQTLSLYCSDCTVSICTVCAQGKHNSHARLEIDEAVTTLRARHVAELVRLSGGSADSANAASFKASSELADRLRHMQQTLHSSSEQAQRDIDSLVADLKAASERLGERLTQQLQQQRQDAEIEISKLLTATSLVAAAGEHLSAGVAEVDRNDAHAFLEEAPRVAQLITDAESRLSALGQLVAASDRARGCVTSLRLDTAGKAALTQSVAQMGSIATRRICPPLPAVLGLQSVILESAHSADLKEFFGRIQIPNKLLYSATRDGFAFKDWAACCLSKGPTMTLIKAKDSGFVFGAYTHCKWPKGDSKVAVVDRSGRSFLFSLTNATGKAARFSLRDKDNDCAIALLPHGVYFGWREISFVLHHSASATNYVRGNRAFSLSKNSSYQPDHKDIHCDAEFFAGSEWFAAADIEVYEL